MFTPSSQSDPIVNRLRIDPKMIKYLLEQCMKTPLRDCQRCEAAIEHIRVIVSRRVAQIIPEVAFLRRQRMNFFWGAEPTGVNGRKELVSAPLLAQELICDEVALSNYVHLQSGKCDRDLRRSVIYETVKLCPPERESPDVRSVRVRVVSGICRRGQMLRAVLRDPEYRRYEETAQMLSGTVDQSRRDPKVPQQGVDALTMGHVNKVECIDGFRWIAETKKHVGYMLWLNFHMDVTLAAEHANVQGQASDHK
jgi:hypothetical protein